MSKAKTPRTSKRGRGRPPAGAVPAAPDDVVFRAAFDAFAEHGYEGTTVRDLAAQLGVSHGFLNARFGSKLDLWYRTVEHNLDAPMRFMDEAFTADYPDELTRLKDVIVRMTEYAANQPSMPRLLSEESRIDSPRLDYLYEHVIERFALKLKALIKRVAEERGTAAPDWLSFMLLLVAGIPRYFSQQPLIRRLGGNMPMSPAEVRKQAEMFADLLLAIFDQEGHKPLAKDPEPFTGRGLAARRGTNRPGRS